ncbi:hypothetical protein J4E81_009518 [Alternaria sp. BMP 2799]|nr:hypothetical protein J4E81_009518 [Alternaria sp. BMP 2799]
MKRKLDEYLASEADLDERYPDLPRRRFRGIISETHSTPVHCDRPLHFDHGCNRCGQQPSALCPGCKVIKYCSPDHQTDDWSNHKKACESIKKAVGAVEKEDQAIRAHDGDADTPRNAFHTAKGRFWKYKGLRPYLKARLALVNAIREVDTLIAVETALEHATDILRLDPRDALCVRSIIPILLLRLDLDERCYWFCKWWLTKGNDTHHDWAGDGPLLALERPVDLFKTEDAFEHLGDYDYTRTFTDRDFDRTRLQSPADLSLLVAIMLVKIRIHIDLQLLRNDFEPETYLQRHVSSVVAARYRRGTPEGFYMREEMELFEALWEQVNILFGVIRGVNKYFWPALIRSYPPQTRGFKRSEFVAGTEAEAGITCQNCYAAWHETPGAIAIIKEMWVRR